ncbi:MAG TPA: TRAM domain-containing protein [Candidatus Eisenbacteria bacterium]|jgi:tRNA/tmRNA/rRNA uracil-C5-methylase (TrmA/RlmC/RlmD family)|nr:TRAM domain-containing protein [Candidatus Eisenbacteria bacterium]
MSRRTRRTPEAPAHKNLEIEIQRLAFGGEGVGFVEGKACFVEGALPGETVIAHILQDKKNFMKARAIKVLAPSASRVTPPCAWIETCGGCQYQHVSYAEELKLKEAQVREVMERSLGLPRDVFRSIRSDGREYRYRNSVTVHRTQKDDRRPQALGFVGRDNRTRVAVADCLLVDERLAPVFAARGPLKKGVERVSFKLSEKSEIVSDLEETFPRIRIGSQSLLASSRGFFQNNLGVTALLAAQVGEWVDETKPSSFFDLYAGVGTFSFLSAPSVASVFCVEESPESLQALRMNRAERSRHSLEIIEGRSEKAFPLVWDRRGEGRAMICLDPPRAGLERELAEFLGARTDASAIVYVSCDLATLVRDLKIILDAGRYVVAEAVPFDMFPRTRHIEIAVLLKPAPSA